MSDTIAAIATAGGVGSISIVRLSGPDAITLARRLSPRASLTPRQADLASLYDRDGRLIDQGIVLYFQAPRSFTGEEIVEFQCHGGLVVAHEILTTLQHYGARLAQPGEFSKRAFLNGKIDASEAEAIAKLIEAQSTGAAHILARQLKGELGQFVEQVRSDLLRILAHAEVTIDYAEEIPDDTIGGMKEQLTSLAERMERIVDGSHRRRGLLEGFRVAIIGKPNVGKSSLLNALLAYDRAIVSDVAGTTRDTIEESVRIGSHVVRLIDTAGIRHSDDTIEQIGVARSLRSLQEADVVIALFDGHRPFDAEDQRILELLEDLPETKPLLAITKNDLSPQLDPKALPHASPLSIRIPGGIQPLIDALNLRLDALAGGEDILLISARQIDAVEAASRSIQAALGPLDSGELELFSYHIREAIEQIGTLTRPYENDEILDKMFGEFCLGK